MLVLIDGDGDGDENENANKIRHSEESIRLKRKFASEKPNRENVSIISFILDFFCNTIFFTLVQFILVAFFYIILFSII